MPIYLQLSYPTAGAIVPLLEVSHLKKSYNDKVVVDDLTFAVEAGEIFGLLGPNGAGKSTAMSMIAGLRAPDAGDIRLDGVAVDDTPRSQRSKLGLVPQELAIYPDLTGRENLQFFGEIYGLRSSRLHDRVECVLDQTELNGHADQPVRTFSGGMKRRLNFGAGLLHEPRLVILDEPTVGVDPQSRSHILDSVRRLAEGGVAVIFATHYMEEAQEICQRVAIIDHGRLLKCGSPAELLHAANSSVHLRVHAAADRVTDALRGIAEVEVVGDQGCLVTVRRDHPDQPQEIAKRLADALERLAHIGAELETIETHEHNLEQLFLELTGRRLRE
jgi:ABC-2 type transport system ATP-binding protein